MARDRADHHDADLLIKVYDLRREPVMRESRARLAKDFWPRSYQDLQAVLAPEHPLNAALRQVGTYWEMVYGMARHGVVHAEYWMEFSGEGLFLFAKVAPFLAHLRRDTSPTAYRNAEWAATETLEGRRLFELFRARVQKTLQDRA